MDTAVQIHADTSWIQLGYSEIHLGYSGYTGYSSVDTPDTARYILDTADTADKRYNWIHRIQLYPPGLCCQSVSVTVILECSDH